MALKRGPLQYFVTVAEDGQMTRAARKLHLAQPALSRAISQLESELGIQLLDRHARGVTLTPAGETFLPKARAALAAYADVSLTARSLARAARGAIDVGFIGPPPSLNAPELFGAFADARPQTAVSFHELPFPCGSTVSWIADVDVAFSLPPAAEPDIVIEPLRAEQRAVVAPESHPLADRSELTVEQVLDDTFISYHPDVQPAWAGFHSLDDHRGEPPRQVTSHRVLTPPDMLAAMASREAITAVPASDAKIILQALRGVVAIPLVDAAPASLALTWRKDSHNPVVAELVAFAQGLTGAGSERPGAAGD